MSNIEMRCGRLGHPCGNDPKLWCRECPKLIASFGPRELEPLPAPSAPPMASAYQVGVNPAFDVLVDFQQSVRYVAMHPDQAIALAGHLKRVAQLAIVGKKKAQRAAKLRQEIEAKLKL